MPCHSESLARLMLLAVCVWGLSKPVRALVDSKWLVRVVCSQSRYLTITNAKQALQKETPLDKRGQ